MAMTTADGTRVVEIDEQEWEAPGELHASLARDLAFPEYYGENLAALSDCLEDVDAPTQLVVRRAPAGHRRSWFDGFCRVFADAARFNPSLGLELVESALPAATIDDVMAALERLDARIDALQEQGTVAGAVLPEATAVPASAPVRDTCRNLASGSDGDRFKCSVCGCRVSDYLEETRQLIDGLNYCPQCGCEVANPAGSNALGWVGELI